MIFPLLAFVAVVIAGSAMRRNGRLTGRSYGVLVTIMALICLTAVVLSLLHHSPPH